MMVMWEEALEAASKLLRVRGRVIPSSTEFIKLVAEMTDGTIVEGENNIPNSGKRIQRISDILLNQSRKVLLACHR